MPAATCSVSPLPPAWPAPATANIVTMECGPCPEHAHCLLAATGSSSQTPYMSGSPAAAILLHALPGRRTSAARFLKHRIGGLESPDPPARVGPRRLRLVVAGRGSAPPRPGRPHPTPPDRHLHRPRPTADRLRPTWACRLSTRYPPARPRMAVRTPSVSWASSPRRWGRARCASGRPSRPRRPAAQASTRAPTQGRCKGGAASGQESAWVWFSSRGRSGGLARDRSCTRLRARRPAGACAAIATRGATGPPATAGTAWCPGMDPRRARMAMLRLLLA